MKEKSTGAGCKYSAGFYRSKGQFYKSPKVGDQIFFGKSGAETHTGIVVGVTSTTVTTIEGNTSRSKGVDANGGMVCEKQYSLGYSKISGYGRPDYSLVTSLAPEEAKIQASVANTATEKDVSYVEVTLKTLQKGENCAQVKTMQALLIQKFSISCGSYGADGDFGSGTLAALKKFQKAKGLTADGVCGQKTWSELLRG